MSELLAEVAGSDRQDGPPGEDWQWLEIRQLKCKRFVQSGTMDELGRY